MKVEIKGFRAGFGCARTCQVASAALWGNFSNLIETWFPELFKVGCCCKSVGYKHWLIQLLLLLFLFDPVSLQPGVSDGQQMAVGRPAESHQPVPSMAFHFEDDAKQAEHVSPKAVSPP